MEIKHFSVLSEELVRRLEIKPDGIYIDATLGLGGHSKLILENLTTGKLISFDQDINAIDKSRDRLGDSDNLILINSNFENITDELGKLGISKVDGIIYDLGTSYYQLTDTERGFTFKEGLKLDMRMDVTSDKDATSILNNYSQQGLEKIFRVYGEEPKHKKLAEVIVEEREINEILTTTQLNNLINKAKGHNKDKNPLTNIYQALRIEVNDEMNVLESSLKQAINLLNVEGKLCVITFHSLEDKIVRNIF